jgi:hypothetical protein
MTIFFQLNVSEFDMTNSTANNMSYGTTENYDSFSNVDSTASNWASNLDALGMDNNNINNSAANNNSLNLSNNLNNLTLSDLPESRPSSVVVILKLMTRLLKIKIFFFINFQKYKNELK